MKQVEPLIGRVKTGINDAENQLADETWLSWQEKERRIGSPDSGKVVQDDGKRRIQRMYEYVS